MIKIPNFYASPFHNKEKLYEKNKKENERRRNLSKDDKDFLATFPDTPEGLEAKAKFYGKPKKN